MFSGNTPIKWFAKSSGTTNAQSKFIPVSNEALEDCHYKASKDLLCLYLNNNRGFRTVSWKKFAFGGQVPKSYEDNNTFFGDLSAILIRNMALLGRIQQLHQAVKFTLISEWETKIA